MLASASFLAGLFAGFCFSDEVENERKYHEDDNEEEPDGADDNSFFYDGLFAKDLDGLFGAENTDCR